MAGRPLLAAFASLAIAIPTALLLARCGERTDGILAVSPARLDFGAVRHGEVREAEVRVQNRGPEDLTLLASTTCKCYTLARPPRALLGPGETEVLVVRFETGSDRPGRYDKLLNVYATGTERHRVTVPLAAEVLRVYEVAGARIHAGRLAGGEEDYAPRQVEIRPEAGWRVRHLATIPLSTAPHLHRLDVRQESPGGPVVVDVALDREARRGPGPVEERFRLDLEVRGPKGEVGRTSETIHIDGFWARSP